MMAHMALPNIDTSGVPARGLFCSEMATLFVRQHVYPELATVAPCQTTAQMLLDVMRAHDPTLEQLALASESTSVANLFVPAEV